MIQIICVWLTHYMQQHEHMCGHYHLLHLHHFLEIERESFSHSEVCTCMRYYDLYYLSGLYLGYLRGRSFPPKMPSFPPRKILLSLQYISNYIGKIIQTWRGQCTFLKIGSQNAPDCISAHTHFKKFPGDHAPGPPKEDRGLRPLRTSPPNDKS